MSNIRLTCGQSITAPLGKTRPTSVRARKALFDVLAHRLYIDFAHYVVLDIFAGAGTLGFEALLRGASTAVFVDQTRAACTQIINNAKVLGFEDQCLALCRDALHIGKRPANVPLADLLFLDPPYQAALSAPAMQALLKDHWLKPDALIIVEMNAKTQTPDLVGFEVVVQHQSAGAKFIILSTAVK